MALDSKHTHPLQHDGTSRDQRFLEALEPGNVPIHEFDLRDWMRFAYHFAEHLKYFSNADHRHPDGNWQAFLKEESEIEAWLKDAALVADEGWLAEAERDRILKREPQGNYEPHLALFLAFLKLTKFSQQHLNGLTARHLDFYYSRVLALSKKVAVPDRAHILFELAKNATLETVPAGALLDGGKDGNGRPLRYATVDELTVNTATVAQIKSVYHQEGATVRYAEMTNSTDGLGTEFTEDHPSWNGFGNSLWPAAALGFALASGVLLMKEGRREINVTLTLSLSDSSNLPTEDSYQEQLMVFLSGERQWLPASQLTVTTIPGATSTTLAFTVTVDSSQQAIIPYDAGIHGERFTTNLPVMRVLVDTGSSEGYRLYSVLSRANITRAEIAVEVTGAKDLVVENDQGRLDPSKPFYPFGPLPKIHAGLYIGSTEVFQKNWQKVSLNVDWQDKPASLKDHYSAYSIQKTLQQVSPDIGLKEKAASLKGPYSTYLTDNLSGDAIVTGDNYFTVIPEYIKDNAWVQAPQEGEPSPLFTSPLTVKRDTADSGTPAPPAIPPLLMKKGIDINKAVLRNYLTPPFQSQGSEVAKKPTISARFQAAHFNPGFVGLATAITPFNPTTKSGFLRLVLQQDFLHDEYAPLLTMIMIDKAKEKPTYTGDLPKVPYTPVIASLTVDYSASVENAFVFVDSATPKEKYDNFTMRAIQLFHEHPFGQAEQHVFLKEQCDFLDDPTAKRNIPLMPRYAPEGELYIGLQHAQPSGSLTLLLEAVEGSENPLVPTFGRDQRIAWHALSNNEWQALNRDFLTADDTNNLLRAGIIRMNLPAAANDSNTVLDSGYFWLKAVLPEGLDHTSVCRLAGIHAQAVTALFTDNGNELSHLAAPLPAGTISKIIDKPALVKAISQPFASFGGATIEDDRAFYLRVSERLHHRQRAVNIWDYERLVLQQFPALYKVKCLSHTAIVNQSGTSEYCEMSPGYVSLVVIPDIRNTNIFDPFQPRASRNVLREIENFINSLNSLHINFSAANPDYETIHLEFRVKFHDRYDAIRYRQILNDDIIRYLSPWAFGQFADIHFGGKVSKSVLIRFIEEREYVDFISHFRMHHRIGEGDNTIKDQGEIVASSARAILVSAREHAIEFIEKDKVCNE